MSKFGKRILKLIIIAAVGVVVSGILSMYWKSGEAVENYDVLVKVGNAKVFAELADTPNLVVKGLSERDGLSDDHGMLFVFPYESNWGIWMKNMKFPIDVLWISKDFKVVDLVKNMLPDSYPKVFAPSVDTVKYVLEIPVGTIDENNINVGQNVVFSVK